MGNFEFNRMQIFLKFSDSGLKLVVKGFKIQVLNIN